MTEMTDEQARALGERAMACKGWRWMEGMRPRSDAPGGYSYQRCQLTEGEDGEPRRHMGIDYVGAFPSWGWPQIRSGWWPDFRDPATVGCLLAVVREAWGDEYLNAKRSRSDLTAIPDRWCLSAGDFAFTGATEAEALVAALEAAP